VPVDSEFPPSFLPSSLLPFPRYNSWKLASGLSEEQAMREYLDLVRISFPAFVKAAASELKDLDDLKSVKEENRALLEETTEVLALYSKLQQVSTTPPSLPSSLLPSCV